MFIIKPVRLNTPNITEHQPHNMSLRKNTFKDKFFKQKNIFKYDSKCNAIELSNFIWKNSCGNISTTLEWDILDKGKDYPKNTHCLLFIYLFILNKKKRS